MNPVVIQICASHCLARMRAAGVPVDLAAKFRDAVEATKDFHEVLSPVEPDDLFRGAFLATWDESDQAGRDRLSVELDALNAFSALCKGIPVDMEAAAEKVKNHEPIGLRAIWLEIYPIQNFPR